MSACPHERPGPESKRADGTAWESSSMADPTDHPNGIFTCSAEDATGAKYVIQVVPTFGGSGPLFLAIGESLRSGPVLRTINRLLLKLQPPARTFQGAALTVTRAGLNGDDDAEIYRVEVSDVPQGRAMALAIADEIRAGTFDPSRKRR